MHRFGLVWGLALLAAGCAHESGAVRRGPHASDESHWLTHRLPVVERGAIGPDLQQIAKLNAPTQTEATLLYHALTADEAQCLAARNSALGNLLASERRATGATSGCACKGAERAKTLQLHLLSFAEMEARNDSAFAALEVYCRLALAEQRVDALGASTAELTATRKQVDDLVRRGVRATSDVGEFDRQTLDIAQQNIDALIGRSQANSALRSLIGVNSHEPDWRIWPSSPLAVDARPIDVELAVYTALNERPELGMLRLLELELDSVTLPVARAALARADALLGFTAPPGCFSAINTLRCVLDKHNSDPCEIEQRKYQLNQYRARREAEIAAEVRHAAATIPQRLDQVLYARERLASFDAHLQQVTARQTTSEATFVEISQARLERMKAASELMDRVVDWHLAVVRFRHTQGTLAAECGYRATCRCWIVPSNELQMTVEKLQPITEPSPAPTAAPESVPQPQPMPIPPPPAS